MGELGRADVFRMRQLARGRCRVGLAFARRRLAFLCTRDVCSSLGSSTNACFACYPSQYANPRNAKRIDRQMMLTIIIVEIVRYWGRSSFSFPPGYKYPPPLVFDVVNRLSLFICRLRQVLAVCSSCAAAFSDVPRRVGTRRRVSCASTRS